VSDPTTLGGFLDMLRSKGVKSYSGPHPTADNHLAVANQMSVEFGPVVEPISKQKTPDEEKCLCGCPVYDHVNGACIRGCALEKCAGPEK
jgi:hypothetical protein